MNDLMFQISIKFFRFPFIGLPAESLDNKTNRWNGDDLYPKQAGNPVQRLVNEKITNPTVCDEFLESDSQAFLFN